MDQAARVRVKYCGITRIEDAQHAAQIGVDAIGLVFYPHSPRAVTLEQAQRIVERLPAFVTRVGLFVNAERSEVEQISEQVGLDLLQFHGDETAQQCEAHSRPYIKALRMQADLDLASASAQYQSAQGLLLDSYDATKYGGTGQTFDWSMIPAQRSLPIILAGGLESHNVVAAIRSVRPYAVDVSGGIESAKGIKNIKKMNDFIRGVEDARS